MPTTIQDIARSLNISHTTVSRVLNSRDDRFISQATKDRVLRQAQLMDYRPNRAARALVTGKTQQIALRMSGIYAAYHAQVIHEVEQRLQDSGFQLIIGAMQGNNEDEMSAQWQVDGFVVFEAMFHTRKFLGGRPTGSIPLVNMGGTNFRDENRDYVGLDLESGSRDALKHLSDVGCQRIAYVGMGFSDPRRAEFERFTQAEGRVTEFILTPSQQRSEVRSTVREYIAAHGCPDGLFCYNDEIALGTYRALRDLNISIPYQTAIVGCDGIEDTEVLDTPLSTILLPVAEMCRTACDFLLRRIDTPSLEPQQVMLRPVLAIRESSRR